MTGSSDDGGEDSTGGVISGEPSLDQAGAVVAHKGGGFVVVAHDWALLGWSTGGQTGGQKEREGMAVLRTAVWTPCPRIERSSSKAHQGWPPPLSSQHHVGWDCTELTLTVDTADYTWLGHAMRICIAVLLDIIDETTTMSVPVSKIHRRWTMNERSGWLLMDNKVIPISIRIHYVFRVLSDLTAQVFLSSRIITRNH